MDGEKLVVSQMTLEALGKALACDTPVPLKSKANKPGLLPGGAATTAKKEALAECLDAQFGLFTKSGSDAEPQVALTEAGVKALFAQTEPGERNKLLAKAVGPLQATAGAVVRELAAAELKEVAKRQEELAARAGELRAQLGRMLTEQLASAEKTLRAVTKLAEELREQVAARDLAGPNPPAEPLAPEPRSERPAGRDRPRPETDGDIDFQSHLCRELALTWEDTPEPEARAALERVMFNAGLEQIGESDQVVPFDAGRYKLASGNGVLPGQPVKVVEPGWEFRSPRGVLPIVQPKVESAPQ